MKNALRFLAGFTGFLLMISSGYYLSFGMGIAIGILGALMFLWALYPLMDNGIKIEPLNWRNFSPTMKERRKNWREKKILIKNLFLTSSIRKRY